MPQNLQIRPRDEESSPAPSIGMAGACEAIVDLRERLTAAFEASLLLSTARQNDIVKKLGSWAAILAVPTAVAGIYAMNFKYMPELEWSFGYPVALLLMLAICGTLYYGFRKAAWL